MSDSDRSGAFHAFLGQLHEDLGPVAQRPGFVELRRLLHSSLSVDASDLIAASPPLAERNGSLPATTESEIGEGNALIVPSESEEQTQTNIETPLNDIEDGPIAG